LRKERIDRKKILLLIDPFWKYFKITSKLNIIISKTFKRFGKFIQLKPLKDNLTAEKLVPTKSKNYYIITPVTILH